MSSAHTHARTRGVFEKISIFSASISIANTSWYYSAYIYTDFMCCNCIFAIELKVLRDVGEKSTFCSLCQPACVCVLACQRACVCVCVGNYAKWSTMKFAALVPLLDTNSVGIFYLTVLSFFQPSSRRCFNTGNALTERRERVRELFVGKLRRKSS